MLSLTALSDKLTFPKLLHSSQNEQEKKAIEWQALFAVSVCSAVNLQMPSKVVTTGQKPKRPTPLLATDDFTIF